MEYIFFLAKSSNFPQREREILIRKYPYLEIKQRYRYLFITPNQNEQSKLALIRVAYKIEYTRFIFSTRKSTSTRI